jgi:hypothetical protein
MLILLVVPFKKKAELSVVTPVFLPSGPIGVIVSVVVGLMVNLPVSAPPVLSKKYGGTHKSGIKDKRDEK